MISCSVAFWIEPRGGYCMSGAYFQMSSGHGHQLAEEQASSIPDSASWTTTVTASAAAAELSDDEMPPLTQVLDRLDDMPAKNGLLFEPVVDVAHDERRVLALGRVPEELLELVNQLEGVGQVFVLRHDLGLAALHREGPNA